MAYAGLWLLLPAERHFDDDAPGLSAATRQGKRPGRRSMALADVGPLVALAAIAIGIIALVAGLTGGAVFLWPLLLAAVGIGVLWRQADEAQRERWRDTTGRIDPIRALIGLGGWASYARIVAGVAFLVGAIVLFAVRGGNIGVARDAVIAALLAVLGVGLMIGPWLFRLSSDLTEERAERIRSQERADVAAHLHDSVLQTLALIQKTADDPAAVARLARAQERDLRQWLYTSDSADGTTFAAALRAAAAEVEDQFGVPVELVCVGDRDLPESVRPLVLAAREAMVNAAKHSRSHPGRRVRRDHRTRHRRVRARPRRRLRRRPGRRRPARRARQHPGPDGAARRRGHGAQHARRGHRGAPAPAERRRE